jgi:hypothetical protein
MAQRRRLQSVLVMVVVAGCALDESGLSPEQDAAKADAAADAPKDVTILDVTQDDAPPPDAPPPPCNPTAAFGSFAALSGVNDGSYQGNPFLTSDELTLFFAGDAGGNRLALFYARRASTADAFPAPTKVSTISTNQTYDSAPFVDDAMTTLYFSSVRSGSGHFHLFEATGSGSPDGWSNVTRLDNLSWSDPAADLQMWVASGTGEVWFASDRAGSLDLYFALSTASTPSAYAALDTAFGELHPTLSHDGLSLFFARTDGSGVVHVWVSTRPSTSTPFTTATQVTDFDDGSANDLPGWLSPDGCRMYFTSDRAGSSDIWMATRGS